MINSEQDSYNFLNHNPHLHGIDYANKIATALGEHPVFEFIEREADELVDLLFMLAHMTVGVTARCTEISKWPYTNYNGKRSLKLLSDGEVLFLSQYHKAKYNEMSSIDKQIEKFPMFIPWITSELIVNFLH